MMMSNSSVEGGGRGERVVVNWPALRLRGMMEE